MAHDSSLIVVLDGTEVVQDSLVVIPRITSLDDQIALARHRGLLDSYVFMRQFHNASMHDEAAPEDGVPERLYNLLERERFEVLGARLYQGARQNLSALWSGSYTPEVIARLSGVEQLEWVISCLCRETLWSDSLPEPVIKLIAPLRGPIEALIGDHLPKLADRISNQQEYAEEVLRLIKKLGFDTAPAQAESQSAGSSEDQTSLEASDPAEEVSDDAASMEVQEEGAEQQRADASEEEQSSLLRNAETESGVEPTQAELDRLTEHAPECSAPLNENGTGRPDYCIYDDQADEIVNALDLVDPKELLTLRDQLERCVGQHTNLVRQLANRLQRHLMARQQRHWIYEQEEGELDTRRLSRMIVDPQLPLSFRVESEAQVRNTAVTILVDNSRSMLGRPMELAAVCAELLTRTLELCGVSSEVLGYTTVSMYGGSSKARWQRAGEPLNPGRLNSIRHIIYKSAPMPWRRAKERFSVMLKPEILKQNIDGEAIQWAHNRLLARTEDKRLLIVISDGAPSDAATLSANDKDLLRRHLLQVVQQVESSSPVQLMAIGIGHDVSAYFSNAMVIHSAEDLGGALLSGLTQMLSDDRPRRVA